MSDRDPPTTERTPTRTAPRWVEPKQSTHPALLWVFPRFGPITRPEATPLRVGRGKDCDTCLPGETISWHHLSVCQAGGVLLARDLGSRNGTRVNGHAMAEDAVLGIGDVVRCGEWLACVVADDGDTPEFGEIAPGLWGGNRLSRALRDAKKLAPSGIPIAIHGPTGTGKERIARAIHHWSQRRGAFVGVNCAELQPELADSRLFGHVRGAFSGAERPHQGFLREANRGTLLLDEFATLAPEVQRKLLRALQEREVRPLGDSTAHSIDVLLLTATHASLDTLVEEGSLRRDLAARLSHLSVRMLALSERREDIAPLFMHFVEREAGAGAREVETDLMEWLLIRPWHQNIRGLEHLAKVLVRLREEPRLRLAHVPEDERTREPLPEPPEGAGSGQPSWPLIVRLLCENGGNVSRTAAQLEIDRSKLRRILKEHPEFDPDAVIK